MPRLVNRWSGTSLLATPAGADTSEWTGPLEASRQSGARHTHCCQPHPITAGLTRPSSQSGVLLVGGVGLFVVILFGVAGFGVTWSGLLSGLVGVGEALDDEEVA